MKRRDFLKTGGLAAGLVVGSRLPGAGPDRPNLLVIHTDEHNFRTLGCYRETLPPELAFMWGEKSVVETPNIDLIAAEGAICTRFYATTPVCSPSRASFVSGQYPQNTPVVNNNIRLDDEVVTFAEILRRSGYATGYSGKWHLDGPGKPQWTPERKFGFQDNRYMYNRGHWKLLRDTPDGPAVGTRNGKPSYGPIGDEKTFSTDFLADKTIEFIDKHKDGPFCYMTSIPDPHGPDTVRAPYDTMFADMTFEKPRTYDRPQQGLPHWARAENCRYQQAKYYGMVRCIDDNVGKILRYLRENELLDRTITIFTSDHGDLRGVHHRHNTGVPMEASARIPFVIRWPAKIKAGTVVKQALGTVDFLPTILALMGFRTTGREEGRDASSLLTTGRVPGGWKDVTFVRGTGRPEANWLGAFTTRYKLIVSPRANPWLVDMERDPDEMKNFFDDPECREVLRDLAGELIDYGEKFRDGRTQVAKVRADLEWCMKGEGDYVPTDFPEPRKKGGRRKGRKRGRGKKTGK